MTYDNADLSFTFDLKGGIFEGLAANPGLDETDYGFNIDTLVISKAYIDSVILADSNRSRIIFSYVISNGPYTVIGYITVNLTN